MIKVSIIGTAGRDKNIKKLNINLYKKMINIADKIIKEEFKLNTKDVCLVSGGASWSDHVAIELFKTGLYSNIELHLPAKFTNDKYDLYSKEGLYSNKLHEVFSEKVSKNTLLDIKDLLNKCKFYNGFYQRNNIVAKSDYLIAFTFYDELVGGTKYTWNKSETKNKIIVNLTKLW